MDKYTELGSEQRRIICEESSEKLNLPAASIEKDYWVCWILRELFNIPVWQDNIIFKGGTSLSKCWNLINRFSEDIDIVIDKKYLGFGGDDSPENAPSKKQLRKRLKRMKQATQKKIHEELTLILAERIGYSLPEPDKWELLPASEEEDSDRQTLLFEYPTAMPQTGSYIRRVVKIEMGARSDSEPVDEIEIHPYLCDAFPNIIGPCKFPVRALAVERTFWEKAMLLHDETYRPASKNRAARMARHYYDLWCLITKGIAEKAVQREDIFNRTAKHRRIYFNWSWMDYSTLVRGQLRLIPLPEQKSEWHRDYLAMSSEMFFGEVPKFDEVLHVIEIFQNEFNSI